MGDKDSEQLIAAGTYAQASDVGIHVLRFNKATGTLATQNITTGVANPSYLDFDAATHRLYAVSETAHGQVYVYQVNVSTGELVLVTRHSTQGGSPCYVSLDRQRRFLGVTNYMGGNVTWFTLAADGAMPLTGQVVSHVGRSVHPLRQEGPHPHSVNPDPRSDFQLVCDLGVDKVLVYRFDEPTGMFAVHSEVATAPGSGPRHIAYHPHLPVVYVVQELTSEIVVFQWDRSLGQLFWLQTVSTLPLGDRVQNTAADVHVSSDGAYLYASNRGHDSVTTWTVADDGRLILRGHTSSGGKTPRQFLLLSDNSYLLVANQDSDLIVVMRIGESGVPEATGHTLTLAKPVCLRALV